MVIKVSVKHNMSCGCAAVLSIEANTKHRNQKHLSFFSPCLTALFQQKSRGKLSLFILKDS